MKLQQYISLSKKHQKVCDYFDSFFVPALNALYWLHTDMKFLKPKLSTWRDEALLKFPRRDIDVSVTFYYDDNVDVSVHSEGTRRIDDFRRHFHWPTDKKDRFVAKDLFQFLKIVIPDLKNEIMNRTEGTQQPSGADGV